MYRIACSERLPVGIRGIPTVVVEVTIRIHSMRIADVRVAVRRAKLEFFLGIINHPVGTIISNASIDMRVTIIHNKIFPHRIRSARRAPPVGIIEVSIPTIIGAITIRVHYVYVIKVVNVTAARRAFNQ